MDVLIEIELSWAAPHLLIGDAACCAWDEGVEARLSFHFTADELNAHQGIRIFSRDTWRLMSEFPHSPVFQSEAELVSSLEKDRPVVSAVHRALQYALTWLGRQKLADVMVRKQHTGEAVVASQSEPHHFKMPFRIMDGGIRNRFVENLREISLLESPEEW